MIRDLNIALINGQKFTTELESQYPRLFHAVSIKDMVRLLLEKPIDLIVLPHDLASPDQLSKIFASYQVPFLLVGGKAPRVKQSKMVFGWAESAAEISQTIIAMNDPIRYQKIHRENLRIRYVIDNLKKFSDAIVHTSRDLFISETKDFFRKNFRLENCHWVEVKPASSKLPGILKLKNELEAQKVSQVALIRDLENCSMEIHHDESFQIWKTHQNEYMAMLWIPQSDNVSQCLILNKVKIRDQNRFRSFLEDLAPILKRRWRLCMTVGEAQAQVYQDSLTSLYNQRFLTDVLAKKIEENKRYKTPFSVLFIDVDHFKRVNDSLGHVIGSGVLKKLGDLLKKQIRNSDYAFRYGGDEFILLLSHTEGDDAVHVAERIRAAVEKEIFEIDGIRVRITVSIGLAFFPKHAQSAEDIVRIADEAMYYGKNKSRNIVYKAS